MLATIVEPPNAHQIDLINKIWNELERIFGDKVAINKEVIASKDPERIAKEQARIAAFVKPYFEYNDGRFKRVPDLAVKLEELRHLVEKRTKKRADSEPEYLLPGETGDGPGPEIQ